MDKIKIVIVDDQRLMRDGLKTILDLEEDMEVIGTAENGWQGVDIVKKLAPDLVLMDIRMPELNGVEAVKLIKSQQKDPVILMLTTFDDDEFIIAALSNGANGYLLKDISGDNLIKSIRDAYEGDIMIPASIAAKLALNISKGSAAFSEVSKKTIEEFCLTTREMDIGRLLAEGLTNKEIAKTLFISIGTVKNYITNLYGKLGVENRASAAIYLRKLGL